MQLFAEGLEFPEGPVAMADGSVVVVEIKGERLTRIAPDGSRTVIAETPGGPNGCAVGPDGAFYICNNGGRFEFEEADGHIFPGPDVSPRYQGGSIQRVDPATGKVTTLYDSYRGERLLSPNDLVFDRVGGLWFTDHGMRDGNTLTFGALYYATSEGELTRPRKNILSPNGVGLSPEESELYIADTITARLYRCHVDQPGKLARDPVVPGPVVVTLPGHQGFDSLAVEADGRICVATLYNGGISIIDQYRGEVEHIPFPDTATTNICFGGDDFRDAWVTCSGTGRLYKCRWPRPGLKLNFSR